MTQSPLAGILRVVLALLAVLALARPASAQLSAATVAGGYSYLRELGTAGTDSTTYPNGWFASVTARLGSLRLAATGEINFNSRTNIIETQRLQAYLGGVHVPVVSVWRMATFARVLAGSERFSEPGFSETGFAFQLGAGVDLGLFQSVALRIQSDYRLVSQEHVTFKEVRFVAGAAVGFGGR